MSHIKLWKYCLFQLFLNIWTINSICIDMFVNMSFLNLIQQVLLLQTCRIGFKLQTYCLSLFFKNQA